MPYLTADDRYIGLRGEREVHIPSDCKRLNIYATAFTYALYHPRISYSLEGFDSEHIETTKQDFEYASYTNLRGGTYRFHLALLNTLTGETEQTMTVTIIKDRAYYEQPWFQISAVVLVLALVLSVAMTLSSCCNMVKTVRSVYWLLTFVARSGQIMAIRFQISRSVQL